MSSSSPSPMADSVPDVIIEEQDSAIQQDLKENLQIFPPNIGGGSGSRGYQTLASQRDLVGQQSGNNCNGAFCFLSYTKYSNPDLYGLIWISTTLVFVIASLCNCATYMMSEKTVSWSFDLRSFLVLVMEIYGYVYIFALVWDLLLKTGFILFWCMLRYSHFIVIPTAVLVAIPMSKKNDSWIIDLRCYQALVMVVYGHVCIVLLGFYFLLKYFGSKDGLIHFWCMWGYSHFISIPSCLLLVIPVGALQWTITLLAGIASAAFVGLNFKCRVLAVLLVIVCVFQFSLTMFVKSWYFHFQL